MSVTTDDLEVEEVAIEKNWFGHLKSFARAQPLGFVGGLLVLAMIIMALFADILAPFDPEENSFENMLTSPKPDLPFRHRSIWPGYIVTHYLWSENSLVCGLHHRLYRGLCWPCSGCW